MSNLQQTQFEGLVPESSDIETVFQRHFKNFQDTGGEVSYQQLQNEESIRRQYSGRVLFELLQNALDRAESRVTVEVCDVEWGEFEKALVVGNDGEPIRVDPAYNYANPPETLNDRRPDFNALCSLHTSNKLPDESVGNKGIGFRSVFWLGDFVRVWSRFAADQDWWGMEMHLPLEENTWRNRLEKPEIQRGHTEFLGSTDVLLEDTEQRPSFHFPLPLSCASPPTPGVLDDVSTIVVVPIRSDRAEKLEESLSTIQESHLNFVGLFEDRRDLHVDFVTPTGTFEKRTWPDQGQSAGGTECSLVYWTTEKLQSKAEAAEHEISAPGAAVAWPPIVEPGTPGKGTELNAKVYGYLPTLIESPFGIDVQGDFQLRTDRTGLKLDDDLIGPYNESILELAAELHLQKLLTEIGIEHELLDWQWIEPADTTMVPQQESPGSPRADLWTFLNPKPGNSDAAEVVKAHVESLLFPSSGSRDAERYAHWATLATKFFEQDEQWSLATYRDFWEASEGWINRACRYSSGTVTWRKTATAMCDAIRERKGAVAPVTATKNHDATVDAPAVPLPIRSETGGITGNEQRHSRRLFLRKSDATDLELPTDGNMEDSIALGRRLYLNGVTTEPEISYPALIYYIIIMESRGNEPDFATLTKLDLNTDALTAVLTDSRRRFVLACLQKYATPMTLTDIADVLASWEHDAELTEIPADDVKNIYIALYHRHIPKLADAGLVEYSQERDAVTLTHESKELSLLAPLLSQ